MRRVLRESAGVVGKSKAVGHVLDQVAKLAAVDTSVLIQGESGTGKELVARALHYNGSRAAGPFVAINCAALPPDLAETELFGHEKGAFTGATGRRRGRFELADKGTLFLDEVAELTPELQAKLLRVLETSEFERVGGERSVRVDVRLVAATNRVLTEVVEAGGFRRDLLYRLNVVSIELPPLRRRKGDILLLIDHFLERSAREAGLADLPRFTDEALTRLRAHSWPGNVRELRNVVERAVVLSEEGTDLGVATLPPRVRCDDEDAPDSDAQGRPLSLHDLEAVHIRRVLALTKGNKKKAAAVLGIERATLYAKIKKYGIGGRV